MHFGPDAAFRDSGASVSSGIARCVANLKSFGNSVGINPINWLRFPKPMTEIDRQGKRRATHGQGAVPDH
jgi:hypothetical protein